MMLGKSEKDVSGSVQSLVQGEEDLGVWGNLKITPHPDVQCSVLDGEAVLLNLKTGSYFTLNQVVTETWELLNGERSLTQVHSAICECFDVREDIARQDLLWLMKHLAQDDLIQPERR